MNSLRTISTRRRRGGSAAVHPRRLVSTPLQGRHRVAAADGRRPHGGCMAGFMPNCNGEGHWTYSREQQANFCRVCSSARRGKMMMSYLLSQRSRSALGFFTNLYCCGAGRGHGTYHRCSLCLFYLEKVDGNLTKLPTSQKGLRQHRSEHTRTRRLNGARSS